MYGVWLYDDIVNVVRFGGFLSRFDEILACFECDPKGEAIFRLCRERSISNLFDDLI